MFQPISPLRSNQIKAKQIELKVVLEFIRWVFINLQRINLIYISFIHYMRQNKGKSIQSTPMCSLLNHTNPNQNGSPIDNSQRIGCHPKKSEDTKNKVGTSFILSSNQLTSSRVVVQEYQRSNKNQYLNQFTEPFSLASKDTMMYQIPKMEFGMPFNVETHQKNQTYPLPNNMRNLQKAFKKSFNGEITLKQAIQNIQSQMARHKCNKSVPKLKKIAAWFEKLPKDRQIHLRKNDYRSQIEQQNQTTTNYDRCHIIGLQVAKKLFILAANSTIWRPPKQAIKSILDNVVNYEGNFVINTHQRNMDWWDMGQRVLLNLIDGYDPKDEQQEKGLLRLMNTIRRRYYTQFFERCLKFGVSQAAVNAIKHKLEQIYSEARENSSREQ